jgi:hypothetical protein
MKFYNAKQFVKDGCIILNLPPEYRLENTADPETIQISNRKYYRLFKENKHLVSFSIVDHLYNFEIRKVSLENITVDWVVNTEEVSLNDLARLYLDNLYYTYNVPSLGKKNGSLFKKTYEALSNRLENAPSSWRSSKLTCKMIARIKEELHNKVKHLHPELETSSIKFNQEINKLLHTSYNFHTLTGEILKNIRRVTTSEGTLYVSFFDNSESFGYRLETSNHTLYWLKANEYLLRGVILTDGDGTCVCPCCGNEVPLGYMEDDPDNEGAQICHSCTESTYQIHGYTTRVPDLLKFKAKKVTPSTVYLGCELEYETTNKNEAAKKVGRALRGHAIMKSDGSIHNGFEIVTCPATLDIHLEVFKKFFSDRPIELKIAANVGMHVHVSRKPLSVLTVGKITEFMNRSDNIKFITHIAGRTPNHYCRQDTERSLSYPLTNLRGGERYNTLNLCNSQTIEFRIFSTPLSYEDFASKIQFCQALVDYSKPGVLDAPLKTQTSYKHFIGWAVKNHRDYPELAAKLKSFTE